MCVQSLLIRNTATEKNIPCSNYNASTQFILVPLASFLPVIGNL